MTLPWRGCCVGLTLPVGGRIDNSIINPGTIEATTNSVGLIVDMDLWDATEVYDFRAYKTKLLPQTPVFSVKLPLGYAGNILDVGEHLHIHNYPIAEEAIRMPVYGKFQTINREPLPGVEVEMHLEQHEDWRHTFNHLAPGDYGIRNNWSVVLPHTFTAVSDANGEVNLEDIPTSDFIRAPYRIKATNPDGIVLIDMVDEVRGYEGDRYVIGVGGRQLIPQEEM